jgi:hypothetical protein
VVQGILDAAREHFDALDPPGLNAAVRLLRATGREMEASELIADFVMLRAGKMLAFTVDPTSDFSKVHIDPELSAALEQMLAVPADNRILGEVFRIIANEGRWSEADIQLLAGQTPTHLETIIEVTEEDDLGQLVRLGVSTISMPDDENAPLRENLGQALMAIAGRSPLR